MAHLEQLWAIAEQREGVPPLLKGAMGERNRRGDCGFTMGQALFGAIFCPLLYHAPCRMSLQGRSSGAVGWGEEQTEMKLLEHRHPLSPSAPKRLCLPAARDRQHLAHRDTPRDSVTNKQ